MALVVSIGAVFANAENPRPTVEIPRLSRAPVLEDFLEMRPPSDLEGELARITGFTQREPEDSQPASQRTEVFLGYDDHNLYCIFVAYDSEPDKIRGQISRRENIRGDDTVEIQLDTYGDRQRALSFLTNPYGVQWDAVWTEGQGFDTSWDTVWQSRAQLTDRGYVAWMAIPFKSLRFSPTSEQTWGLVFVRDIPRNNEVSFWPQVTIRIEGRLNQAATLRGLSGISPGRNIWLIPYATAARFRDFDLDTGELERDGFDPDAGLDAKLVFRDSLTLDLTANPDFSQVESDQAQVTVNQRFEVFFPEKRPFFLENASYFQTPVNLLFTRRIVDPSAGARLTGKLGRFTVGGFLIDDKQPGRNRDSDDPLRGKSALFTVLRVSRDLPRQARVGLTYTERKFDSSHNRVVGVDGRFKIGDNWTASLQAIYSATRDLLSDGGERSRDPGYNVVVNRDGRKFGAHIHYQEAGRDFKTESGFVPRVDFREIHQEVSYTFRPEGQRLIAWGPRLFLQHIEDQDGLRLDTRLNPELEWEFRRQTRVSLFASFGRDRLRPREFSALPGPRDFSILQHGLFFRMHAVEAVEFESRLAVGRQINFVPPAGDPPASADVMSASIELTLRLLDRLRNENTYLFTRLEDRAGGQRIFTNQILRSRWSWQFNPKLSLRAILRYDRTNVDPLLTSLERNRQWNADFLLTYLVNPWTALYVGYNGEYSNREIAAPGSDPPVPHTRNDLLNNARQVFLKFSYLFRL